MKAPVPDGAVLQTVPTNTLIKNSAIKSH